jgi:HlyD family secretion protein
VVVALAGGYVVLRGRAAKSAAASATAASANTIVKVAKGDLTASITASGQLQPSVITTIRPDSNMPTRKLVKILTKEGERVTAGQALAEIDPSGLDLDLKSAQATYEAQKARLANLKAKPAGLDLAQAQGDLAQAKLTLDSAQESYDNTKALADKELASKSQLSDAARQLALAQTRYDTSQLSYQSVKSQSSDDVTSAQEASLAQADSALQKARLVAASTVIRSPVAGQVAEITVNVGDLVGPSTAMMTVIDPDPMWLQAQVNENDMVTLKIGQAATVTPSGYPDMVIRGKVTTIDLRAQTQANVSVFTTTIEVPNRDGKLLWGMNADAEISVLSIRNVLTLPTNAIKTSNGASTVTIMDGGELISWNIQTGATDGSRTEIVMGLDEGDEVVIQRKSTTSTAATGANRQQGGPGGMGAIFGILR